MEFEFDQKKPAPFDYNSYTKPSLYKSEFDELERVPDEDLNLFPVGFHNWDSITKMEYKEHMKRRSKIYRTYVNRRRIRQNKGEDLSSSEDEEGNKKTGYELTKYMCTYNANTKMDFTEGYDPKSLDAMYKSSKIYNKNETQMPLTIDFAFELKYSSV